MILKTGYRKVTKKPNPFLSILINIVIPVLILMKLGNVFNLSPITTLVVALLFPLGYGLFQFFVMKDINFFSILGFISILLTEIIGITQIDSQWIILKEASVPLIIALIILVFEFAGFSLVRKLFNEIIYVKKISKAFKKKKKSFSTILRFSAYLLAGVFFISSVLNYILAKSIIKSQPGTEAFNAEIAKMLALSFPVIALPAIIMVIGILIYIILQIKKHTDLDFESIFR